MPDGLDAFHFLRPWWLLLIPAALWLHGRLRRAVSAADQWGGIIDPELLQHLVIGQGDTRRIRPYQALTILFLLMSLALAGPSWQREVTPFTEDRAPLIIALELNRGMLGIDQPPSRLERAKQKIRDLLQRRHGARTALIGYAGSAHAVLPLTDDVELIELYLESLSPDIMPTAGDRPDLALTLANEMLETESAAGTILFMTDGLDRSYSESFAQTLAESSDQLLVLLFGTASEGPLRDGDPGESAPPADVAGTRAVSGATGGRNYDVTVDDGDVESLVGQTKRHLVNAIESDENLQWRDAGYVLVWPLALLALLWFRRGWTIQWQ